MASRADRSLRARRQSGFTLAEALVVVAVAGLAMSMGLAGLDQALPSWRIDSASRDIAISLRAARAMATLESDNVLMPFDTTRGLYALVTETTPGITIEESGIRYAELPPGVTFSRPDTGDAITFAPPAAPSEKTAVFDPSGLLLSNVRPADVFVGNPDEGLYRRIRVNLVGMVNISSWNGSSWE